MARSEARIFSSIWADPDFACLSRSAQGTYFFLLSQEDLAYDGVLPYRLSRWAGTAKEFKPRALRGDLAALEALRFVVVDESTEEVLVRSLMRRDGVFKQPNLLRAAAKHLPSVRSAVLRAVLADELRRIEAEEELTPNNTAPLVMTMLAHLANPSANPLPNPSRGGKGARGVVTVVTTESPLPRSPAHPREPAANPSSAERTVLAATDASDDEARAVVALVRAERKPTNLPGLLRSLAEADELVEWLARVRTTAALAAARHEPDCQHGMPGGRVLHPQSGLPLCPLCRTESRRP